MTQREDEVFPHPQHVQVPVPAWNPSHIHSPACARTKAEIQASQLPPSPFHRSETPLGPDSGLKYSCFKSHPLTHAAFHLVMVCLACP